MLLTVGMLAGGLGLFLLAVTMITDGLKVAAGEALRDVLARHTGTRLRGVFSGVLITGVVQSSSAVTVATLGFVNAGLLNFTQSIGVIYGANVGTTTTGWLIAMVGFNLELEALGLPLVGLGMLARVVGNGRRLGAMGEAVAGFGLFFIGIDVLREAFTGIAADIDLAGFAPAGPLGTLLYVGIGVLITQFTQSSSAGVALILTAAAGGALSLPAAAAMVIGTSIGTTSTAVLAAIGATANARRVAAVHVLFNVVTGAAALLLLPVLLWLVTLAAVRLDGTAATATVLALFHTVFKVFGVLLMWPLTDRLATFLSRRFVTRAEMLAQPAFLDRTVLVSPVLAIEALKHELLRVMELTREAALAAVSRDEPLDAGGREQLAGLRGLLGSVAEFIAELEADRLPAAAVDVLPELLRVSNYLEDVVDLISELEEHRADLRAVIREPVQATVNGFRAAVAAQIDRCQPQSPAFDPEQVLDGQQQLEESWHALKDHLLIAASRRALPLRPINDALEALRSILRMAEQLAKAANRMAQLAPTIAAQPAQAPVTQPPAQSEDRESGH